MKFRKLPGTRDILPDEALIWEKVESVIRETAKSYSFFEITTPTFESSCLFTHSVGDTTDIVTKEMYTFIDKGGREITLKPEGTAPVVRAYIENNLSAGPKPVKLFYIDRFFRYERPQKGRLREFHQFGAEVFGSSSTFVEVELLKLSFEILEKLGFNELIVDINTIGCRDCSPKYKEALRDYLNNQKEELCDDCKNRVERNVLRVLDCKKESCKKVSQNAPKIINYLCNDCKTQFEELKTNLDKFDINYKLNEHLVRGLDYYDKTVFEVISSSLGSQNALLGGGRYDYLVKDLGGIDTPACGFALGMERLIMLIIEKNLIKMPSAAPFIYIINTGNNALIESFKLANILRKENFITEVDLEGKGIKKGLSFAEKKGIKKVIIIGEDEVKNGKYTLRDMDLHSQDTYFLDDLMSYLKSLKVEEE